MSFMTTTKYDIFEFDPKVQTYKYQIQLYLHLSWESTQCSTERNWYMLIKSYFLTEQCEVTVSISWNIYMILKYYSWFGFYEFFSRWGMAWLWVILMLVHCQLLELYLRMQDFCFHSHHYLIMLYESCPLNLSGCLLMVTFHIV